MTRVTAVILAGSRPGDAVAQAGGASHKAMVEVDGVPMIVRVAKALRESRFVGALNICIEESGVLAGLTELGDSMFLPTAATPSRSVLRAAEALGFPLLVTTADHALLSAEMVDYFCNAALQSRADLAVGLAPASVILRGYPDAVRTFLPFRDDRYSGCNMFALLTPASLDAVRFWIEAEQFRKRPWRLVGTFGPLSLLLFALGRLTLDAAMQRASRTLGIEAVAIKMPFAEAAIDVDKPADLDLVRSIARRQSAGRDRRQFTSNNGPETASGGSVRPPAGQ